MTNQLLYSAQPVDSGALVEAFRRNDWRYVLPELRPEHRMAALPFSQAVLRSSLGASPLAAIASELAAAETAMVDRRYQDAVELYQGVRRRIYALISDGRRSQFRLPGRWLPPHNAKHFDKMLEAGIRLIETELAASDQLAVVEAVPQGELGELAEELRVGLRVDPGLPDDLARLERRGRRLAQTGDWSGAARVYRGLAANPAVSEEMRAALLLNQGAASIQAGDLTEGQRALEQASRDFHGVGDLLGLAQARHNLAVASAAAGETERARSLFDSAEKEAVAALGATGTAVTVASKLGKLGPGILAGLTVRRTLTAEIVGSIERADSGESPAGAGPRTLARPATLGEVGSGLQLLMRASNDAGWESSPLVAGSQLVRPRKLVAGVVAGQGVVDLAWSDEQPLRPIRIREVLYDRRRVVQAISGLGWTAAGGTDLAMQLPHLYYYVTPLELGDAHRGLGNWSEARKWYWLAVEYEYLNLAIEGPVLWERIAATLLEEGDEHYRNDRLAQAMTAYGQVVLPGPRAPGGEELYQHPKMSAIGTQIAEFIAEPDVDTEEVPLAAKAVVLDLMHRVMQLDAGLDWLGMPADVAPPFTFEYLQAVARQFVQQAQAAAREYIQFQQRFDEGRLTRLQLAYAVTDAGNEAALARHQEEVALQEQRVAEAAHTLATIRSINAHEAHVEFAAMAPEQIELEALSVFYASDPDRKSDGEPVRNTLRNIREKLVTLTSGYEQTRLQDTVRELNTATKQTAAQVELTKKRKQAAGLAAKAAETRAVMAEQLLDAYDRNAFDTGTWVNLANAMKVMSRRYLDHATRVARLMQRAYEFEYHVTVPNGRGIRTDYSGVGVAIPGPQGGGLVMAAPGIAPGFAITAADELLADIDWFTFHRVTETRHRTLRGSIQVSMASRHPFLLQTEFRRTGRVAFETLLADVERQWPGSFLHRVQAVEVEVVGLLPREGVHGTLRNGGVSQYRTVDGNVRWRIQPPDTMLVSAYSPMDAPSFRHRPEQLAVFEGAGLAGTWILDIPLATNDLDPATVVDVVLTFHFEALFDRELEAQVRAVPTPPEALRSSQVFSLRWDFPDRFFLWHSEGEVSLEIDRDWFPHHHAGPTVRLVAMQLLGQDGAAPPVVPLTLGAPGRDPVTVTPDGSGRVPSTNPALASLAGATVAGGWPFAAGADRAIREQVYDVLLFVEYDFTERGES
jgi:tetratricopeptide (TPR) repeat protein